MFLIRGQFSDNRPVLDRLDLHGAYLFFNSWYDSYEDFRSAVIEDKMGLKLESPKAPMDVLIIDPIERPAAN